MQVGYESVWELSHTIGFYSFFLFTLSVCLGIRVLSLCAYPCVVFLSMLAGIRGRHAFKQVVILFTIVEETTSLLPSYQTPNQSTCYCLETPGFCSYSLFQQNFKKERVLHNFYILTN